MVDKIFSPPLSFRLHFEKLTTPAQNHGQDEKNYRRQHWIRNRYGKRSTMLTERLQWTFWFD
ncbi:MAG: hypothetical protein CMJ81_05270 [Planctomycetaceae bacterium]|nr:hypothetical protein [Planctomycetaceae bacterium]